MNGRQKLRQALAHSEGPVPVDFGSSSVTGMHVTCVIALREYYGLERRRVRVHEPHQMLGMVEDDLRDAMGIDVQGISKRKTTFGFPADNWKSWKLPGGGPEVLVPGNFNVT